MEFIAGIDALGYAVSGSLYAALLLADSNIPNDEPMAFDGGTVRVRSGLYSMNERAPYFILYVERSFRPVPNCAGHWEPAYCDFSFDVTVQHPNGEPVGEDEREAQEWAVRESSCRLKEQISD